MSIRYHLTRFALFAAVVLSVVACAPVTPPPVAVVVQGNGKCKPAVDLPAHKVMKKVPVADIFMEDLFALLGIERKAHAQDIRDYNSLYDTCVGQDSADPK